MLQENREGVEWKRKGQIKKNIVLIKKNQVPNKINSPYAMFIAVSILSPVNTQILIPALERVSIQDGTPSWSLSSIAVQPIKVRSFSISSDTYKTRIICIN